VAKGEDVEAEGSDRSGVNDDNGGGDMEWEWETDVRR
jgi:hypothetical protein